LPPRDLTDICREPATEDRNERLSVGVCDCIDNSGELPRFFERDMLDPMEPKTAPCSPVLEMRCMGRTCSGEMASASLVGPPEMEDIRSSCAGKVVLRGRVVGGVMGFCIAMG
jgi:hypothetical protein